MSEGPPREFYLWSLFQQLLRRGFAIGLDEYGAVREALRAGFGWSSREELKKVLCALWATSREEAAVIGTLFDQHVTTDWDVNVSAPQAPANAPEVALETVEPALIEHAADEDVASPSQPIVSDAPTTAAAPSSRLPPLRMEELPRLPYSHIFLPQFPAGYREVVQTWRRLRRPLREGPATELDLDATIERRARSGVASPPVLRARRRNRANLLLLVDRKGSMAPFHGYVDEVCKAIAQAGRLGRVGMFYFHDAPLEGADLGVLGALEGELFPSLDAVLSDIPELTSGVFFDDPELLIPHAARSVLSDWSSDTAIVVISDAGAARKRLDLVRLLDSIASLKGLLAVSRRVVWLNPLPMSAWPRTTAGQIARHVPMFVMDRDGMQRAVNVLRGQPVAIDHPLTHGTSTHGRSRRASSITANAEHA